jgi:hypothetical protein
MIQKTTQLLVCAVATAVLAGSADAALILYVTNGADAGETGALLTNAGHTVSIYDDATHGWNLPNQAAEDYVNGFDLIMISRTVNFGGIRGHGAKWNALETPMINLNQYLVSGQFSSASWRWGTSNGSAQGLGSNTVLDVLAPSDPYLSGIALTPGSPETVVLNDEGARVWQLGGAPVAGVTPVVVNAANPGQIYAAYAAQDALRPGGAPQYYIAGPGGDTNDDTWNAAGETALLNAVNTLVPEPGSLALLGLGSLLVARRRRG